MRDVIVIGGGLTGLSAAQVLGRQKRDTLVIDDGTPRNAAATQMHMFPSQDGIDPAKLRFLARRELDAHPSVEVRDASVTSVAGAIDDFTVALADGTGERARRLLLATGVVDVLPDIEGLAERWGRTVNHCPLCHGHEVHGKTVAVLGSGPSSALLALYLRDRFCEDVVFCASGPAELSAPVADALAKRGIAVREEPIARVSGEADVEFTDGSTLTRQALFHRTGERQHAAFAAELGAEILPDGWVQVDAQQRTTVPGVYAAGDLARTPEAPVALTFVLAGAAAGQTAAVWLDGELFRASYPTAFGG